jgi:hypothetical protein
MKSRITIVCAAIGALGLASAAHAATNANDSNTNAGPTGTQNESSSSRGQNLRMQFTKDLKIAGFTDIRVMPESFLVRAKDKRGRPVMMVINPDSVAEVIGPKTNRNNQTSSNESSNSSNTQSNDQSNNQSNDQTNGSPNHQSNQ